MWGILKINIIKNKPVSLNEKAAVTFLLSKCMSQEFSELTSGGRGQRVVAIVISASTTMQQRSQTSVWAVLRTISSVENVTREIVIALWIIHSPPLYWALILERDIATVDGFFKMLICNGVEKGISETDISQIRQIKPKLWVFSGWHQ